MLCGNILAAAKVCVVTPNRGYLFAGLPVTLATEGEDGVGEAHIKKGVGPRRRSHARILHLILVIAVARQCTRGLFYRLPWLRPR